MTNKENGLNRKDQHIALANQQYQSAKNAINREFEQVRFVHQSLPQLASQDIDLHQDLPPFAFQVPFFINAITGGSQKAGEMNRRLAIVARETGLALASGSVSAALKDPSLNDTFTVLRKENPDGLIFANLGAHHHVENAKRAVDLLEADALQLHVNAPQEMVMPEGDRDFSDWLRNIETIVRQLEVPVIVKEVGFGMSRETVASLRSVGVQWIDVSGTGGTDFARIENARRPKENRYDFLEGWGQSTAVSLLEAQSVQKEGKFHLIASGGVTDGLEVAKSLALGADLVGLSNHFLHLVRTESQLTDAIAEVGRLKEQLRLVMTLLGTRTVADLRRTDLIVTGNVLNWCQARGLDWQGYANRSRTAKNQNESFSLRRQD